MTEAMNFQSIIMTLQEFWAEQGCLIWQPYYTQVGAGTMNPATFLRVLGPEPWNVAYVEPSIRPDDGRYGENPNRMQMHYQFQVILKPDPGNPQELYLQVAGGAGHRPAPARHPLCGGQLGVAGAGRLGAGLGSLAGRAGDHPVHLLPAGRRHAARPGLGGDHLRAGAHRHGPAARATASARSAGARSLTDGDVNLQGEQEHSKYYFEVADVERLRQMYRPVRGGGATPAWSRGWCCRRTITC